LNDIAHIAVDFPENRFDAVNRLASLCGDTLAREIPVAIRTNLARDVEDAVGDDCVAVSVFGETRVNNSSLDNE
jgi:hypothetical protein